MTIALHVNAASHEVDADPSTPLLYVLRNELALHGPKFGCGLGQCGACLVHLDGRAAFSCILPIAAVGERKVTTLEGLIENGKPNKLQQAFIDEQAAQCGYCISGMVMRAETLLRVNPVRPTMKFASTCGPICAAAALIPPSCARSSAPPWLEDRPT
jgi:nicotinate dehydrogenase subunit A